MFFVLGNSQAQKSLVQEISVPYLKKLIETAQQNYPKMKFIWDTCSCINCKKRTSEISEVLFSYTPNSLSR